MRALARTALPRPPGFDGMYQIGSQLLMTSGAVFSFISHRMQLAAAALSLLLGLWILSRGQPASVAGRSQRRHPPSQSPR